ncbi:hypothetical protein [Haemophilus parahaemolyticus]|jgi:hypothetical protein|uniref:hypothetical protein n=1 Tax=Haemophilus parahaemolyticus TaxID=735 RepID=UPI0028E49322|nr:hypothetical protein [Haemophilus parahaemolyticus]
MLLNKSYPQYSIEEVSDQHKAMELLLESAKQQNNDAFMLLSEIYKDFPNKKEYKKIDLSRYVNSPYYTYHSNSPINNEYILKSRYNIFYDSYIRDISTSEGLLLRSIEKGNKKGIRKFCEEAKLSEYRQYFSNLSRHPNSRFINTDYDFKNIQKIITNLAEQGDYDMLKCTTLAIPNRYWAVKLVTHPDFSWTGLENKEKKDIINTLAYFSDRAVEHKPSSKLFAKLLCEYYQSNNNPQLSAHYCEIYDILNEEETTN